MSDTPEEESLAHYGVPGMKWGKRKSRNADYSDQQRKRDAQVYGRGGVKRINKAMNEGDKIGVARGAEKTRRDRTIAKNPYARQVGKIAGAGVGVVAMNVGISAAKKAAYSPATVSFLSKAFGKASPGVQNGVINTMIGARKVSSLMDTPEVRAIASAGAAAIGQKLSGDIAVGINMRSKGYDPNRKY